MRYVSNEIPIYDSQQIPPEPIRTYWENGYLIKVYASGYPDGYEPQRPFGHLRVGMAE